MLPQLKHELERHDPDSILAFGAEPFTVFHSRVLHWFSRKHVPEAETDDVVQEALLSVHDHLNELDKLPTKDQRRWLDAVFRNKAIDALRKRRRRQECPLDDLAGTDAEPAASEPTPPEVLEFQWRRAGVRAALDELRSTLDARNFRILYGHAIEGQTHAELAEELGMTEHQVRQHYSWCMQKLKVRLEAYFGTEGENL
jgi:RNA polymerase sigma factor (sigma-70 family)